MGRNYLKIIFLFPITDDLTSNYCMERVSGRFIKPVCVTKYTIHTLKFLIMQKVV